MQRGTASSGKVTLAPKGGSLPVRVRDKAHCIHAKVLPAPEIALSQGPVIRSKPAIAIACMACGKVHQNGMKCGFFNHGIQDTKIGSLRSFSGHLLWNGSVGRGGSRPVTIQYLQGLLQGKRPCFPAFLPLHIFRHQEGIVDGFFCGFHHCLKERGRADHFPARSPF
jgi:hypothetical protein